ncbi:MAG: hypothetical protein KDB80_00975 [Planctomycetes bacterium]|nr:hypothetical protein [Planctomycetota bacterium]
MPSLGRFGRISLLALVVVAAATIKCSLFPGRAFDAALWHDDARVKSGIRRGMADRMLADEVLLGRSRAEVVALLGEPPPTAYFSEWDLVYWLGPERGLISVDSEWLVIRLGRDGCVCQAGLVRD